VPKVRINPTTVFCSLDSGFSQAVAASGRRTLYVSGQTAWDAGRRLLGGADLGAQIRQALKNLREVLRAAGGTLADVVSVRIYIVNYTPDKAPAIGAVFREFFPAESAPAATWVGVSALADPGFLVELEATAVLD
jgi:enamine deaminase RidA (YjgF/YER057c/UK114 family)